MSNEPDCAAAAGNLSRSLERLATTAKAYAHSQLDRAADAIQAEKRRRMWMAFSGAAVLLWLSIGAMFAGIAIVVAFWETHRVTAIVAVAVGFFALAGVAAWVLCRNWRQRPTAFEWIAGVLGTLAEFRRQR